MILSNPIHVDLTRNSLVLCTDMKLCLYTYSLWVELAKERVNKETYVHAEQ